MKKRKLKFRPGMVSFAIQDEERLFALGLAKFAKPKTDREHRMLKRFILRLMGEKIGHINLNELEECPICERNVRYLKRHVALCKVKQQELKNLPKVDPEVLEMLNAGM